MQTAFCISPAFRCGTGWLHNCLLELGIRVDGCDGEWWQSEAGELVVHKSMLKDFMQRLPIVSRKKRFSFRSDFQVIMGHMYPPRQILPPAQVVLMVRDPRDALLSDYRHYVYQAESQGVKKKTFDEFICMSSNQAFTVNLLNGIDEYCVYYKYWLSQPNVKVIRFEDYKVDPLSTLQAIIDYLGLSYELTELEAAVENSSFEKAKTIEQSVFVDRKEKPGTYLHHRAGKVGEYLDAADDEKEIIQYIETQTSDLLISLGYSVKDVPKVAKYKHTSRPITTIDELCLQNVLSTTTLIDPFWFQQHEEAIHPTVLKTIPGGWGDDPHGVSIANLITRSELNVYKCILENLSTQFTYALWGHNVLNEVDPFPRYIVYKQRMIGMFLYTLTVLGIRKNQFCWVGDRDNTFGGLEVRQANDLTLGERVHLIFDRRYIPIIQRLGFRYMLFEQLINVFYHVFEDNIEKYVMTHRLRVDDYPPEIEFC
ncbi:MAG: sulfotransferase domain-containing protein [Nitrospirales bacterium]